MDILERAGRLKAEADYLMQEIRLYEILLSCASVTPTGSYFLDVMVYPDIDLYISRVSIEQLFHIAGQLAQSELVIAVVFEKSADPRLPGGLYLKPRLAWGEWGRPWKIDIWSLEASLIEQNLQTMRHFKENMTPYLREQILRYKISIMTPSQRPPPYSGYFIYKAFIDEGMVDFQQVTGYLLSQGIQMAPAALV